MSDPRQSGAPTRPPRARRPRRPGVPEAPPVVGAPTTVPAPAPVRDVTRANRSPNRRRTVFLATSVFVVGAGLVGGTAAAIASGWLEAAAPPTATEPTASASASTSNRSDHATVSASTPPTGELTGTQRRLADWAQQHLAWYPISRTQLIDIVVDAHVDRRVSRADATIAVDSLDVDWNEVAVRAASSLIEGRAFSKLGLLDQLTSEFGPQFTLAEASYAVENVEVDWDAQPARWIRQAVDSDAMSYESLVRAMTSPHDGRFTQEEAEAAIESANIDFDAEAVEAAEELVDRASDIACNEIVGALTGSFYRFTREQAGIGAEAVGRC